MAQHYYNELAAYPARWLSNLVNNGALPPGHVDAKDIAQINASDLHGYSQCHFFAGIGGWPLALQLAGVPETTQLWTGSCPCQPFSIAGKRKRTHDIRHLWRVWYHLITECRPPIIFGEQVTSPAGRDWLAAVRSDLEALGYAVGAADLCAASAGAPHIRQRLFFVGLADGYQQGLQGRRLRLDEKHRRWESWSHGINYIPCTDGKTRPVESSVLPLADGVSGRVGRISAYGNAIVPQITAHFIRAALGG